VERGNKYAKNQKPEIDHSYCNRFDFSCGHRYGAPAQLIRNYRPNRLNSIFRFFIKECSEDDVEKQVNPMCQKAEERLRREYAESQKITEKLKMSLNLR